ncbi:hypothetical protein J4416_03700 [Candidatus Pacearchaeota archaeon]|nr:hypothetical protein [Candidatus Pacearchaeota archaeon]
MSKRKGPGYWQGIENARKALRGLESKLGHFPTQKEIAVEFSGLAGALTRYYGGLTKFKKDLGKSLHRRENGYWTLQRTKQYCTDFIAEHGKFPTQKDLSNREDRYRGLNSGIDRNGGILRIRRLLGVEIGRKPVGYWKESQHIIEEIERVMGKEGWQELPSPDVLRNKNYGRLVGEIQNYGGMRKVRRKLGLEVVKVEDGFWTEERILAEAKKVVAKQGDLPAQDSLKKLGLGALAGQIGKNGGYPYFREKLGLVSRRKPHRFWDRENTYTEADRLYREYGDLPLGSKLRELGMGTLPGVASEHYGGLVKLRAMLRKAHGDDTEENEEKMRNLSYISEEIQKLQKKHGLAKFPGRGTLKKLGRSDLVSAIQRYHGGMNNVRRDLGEKSVSPKGTWDNPDYVLKEAQRLMNEQRWETWPSESVVGKTGNIMIPNAIRKAFGSMNAFRKILGEERPMVEPGQWRDLEYTVSQALQAFEDLKVTELPPQKYLSRNGYSGLSTAITKYHGGFPQFRELLRQRITGRTEKEQLGSLLEQYVSGGSQNE